MANDLTKSISGRGLNKLGELEQDLVFGDANSKDIKRALEAAPGSGVVEGVPGELPGPAPGLGAIDGVRGHESVQLAGRLHGREVRPQAADAAVERVGAIGRDLDRVALRAQLAVLETVGQQHEGGGLRQSRSPVRLKGRGSGASERHDRQVLQDDLGALAPALVAGEQESEVGSVPVQEQAPHDVRGREGRQIWRP